MAQIFIFALSVGVFAALGMLAASTWGIDSRPSIGDDHVR
jgi:hypothetical protein